MPANTRPKKFVAVGTFRQADRSYEAGDVVPNDNYLPFLLSRGFAVADTPPAEGSKSTKESKEVDS